MTKPWGEKNGPKGHEKAHENVPFWVLDGVGEIETTLLERMAGTTGLEPAASAVTVKHLRTREGTQKRVKKGKGTLDVPVLFPDLGVGIPNHLADGLAPTPNRPPAFSGDLSGRGAQKSLDLGACYVWVGGLHIQNDKLRGAPYVNDNGDTG
jgi:hypothetical protein